MDAPNATLDLDAIEKRATAATRGPWVVIEHPRRMSEEGAAEWRAETGFDAPPFGTPSRVIGTAWINAQLHGPVPVVTLGSGIHEPPEFINIEAADAEFIAHAREDVPALCERVRELLGVIVRAHNESDPSRVCICVYCEDHRAALAAKESDHA